MNKLLHCRPPAIAGLAGLTRASAVAFATAKGPADKPPGTMRQARRVRIEHSHRFIMQDQAVRFLTALRKAIDGAPPKGGTP